MVDIFKKGKFKLLAFTETELKRKGEVSWSGVNVIFAGVQEMKRAREGLAVLLNDVLHSASGLNSRFQGLKFVWWRGMDQMKEMVKKRHGQDSG